SSASTCPDAPACTCSSCAAAAGTSCWWCGISATPSPARTTRRCRSTGPGRPPGPPRSTRSARTSRPSCSTAGCGCRSRSPRCSSPPADRRPGRRLPVELRGVRLGRAAAAVRPQRLRPDPARAVRVRRQADGLDAVDPRIWWLGPDTGGMDLPVMPPVAPSLARPAPGMPEGPGRFEPKWEGFRTIVFRDGDEVELGSRNERPMTRYFPEIVEAVRANLPPRCVVDAEIVVPDATGHKLDFDALLLRIHPAASRVALLATQTPARLI